MTSTVERAAEIRRKLKAMGFSSRKVGVKVRYSMYDAVIELKLKDIALPVSKIEEIANKQEHIYECERTGEILAGGNTFVRVNYSWEAEQAAKTLPRFKDLVCAIKEAQTRAEKSECIEDIENYSIYKIGHKWHYKNNKGCDYKRNSLMMFFSPEQLALEMMKGVAQ